MDNNEENIEGIPTLTEEELKQLTEEIEIAEKTASLNQTRKRNFEMLDNILSDYLDSFILLGYTADGDEIIFHKLSCPRDTRSLNALLNEVSMSGYFEELE